MSVVLKVAPTCQGRACPLSVSFLRHTIIITQVADPIMVPNYTVVLPLHHHADVFR